MFALHLTDPIPSVLQYRRDVPKALDDVVRKALAKSRKDRFADASEFAKALRELSTGPAVAPAKQGRSRYKFVGALAFVFILAGATLLLNQQGDAQPVASEQRIESLAVLPFANLSGDASEQPFVDGMTDLLITRLAEVNAFTVISRRSVMRYKETDKSLPDIATELNVDAIVEGSVLRVGDRVRIGAQLIHATTDRHLWATDYEWDLQDVLALQSEVARAITEAITAELARPVPDSS
jgi:TolB-like protein